MFKNKSVETTTKQDGHQMLTNVENLVETIVANLEAMGKTMQTLSNQKGPNFFPTTPQTNNNTNIQQALANTIQYLRSAMHLCHSNSQTAEKPLNKAVVARV